MSVNKVLLIGNLGKDPEVRYTPNGTAVANFTMATTERYKDRDGQQQEKTEWHNIVVWRELAEICGKYLHKGKQVYIEGKIQTRSYDDRDGNKRYITEIVANEMKMLGPKTDQGGSQQRPPTQSGAYGSGGQGTHGQQRQPANYSQPTEPPLFDPDSEIPF